MMLESMLQPAFFKIKRIAQISKRWEVVYYPPEEVAHTEYAVHTPCISLNVEDEFYYTTFFAALNARSTDIWCPYCKKRPSKAERNKMFAISSLMCKPWPHV